MKNPGFKSTAEGFTLVEMCVVIAIFAILAAISIPNYVSWKPTYRLRQAANDMLSDFQSVRSQAIKRNAQCAVSLDQTVDGELYDYVGYVDENGDFTYDSDEEVLVRNRFDNYGSVSFIGDDFLDGSGQLTLAFRFDGIPLAMESGGATFPRGGNLTIENTAGKISSLNISIAGAIWLE